jgi:hypothetical protein
MQWIRAALPPALLTCVYCGCEGPLPHRFSYEFVGRCYALHACPDCGSLHYFPQETLADLSAPGGEPYREDTRLGVKFNLEAGYSLDLVVHCALAALAPVAPQERASRLFVDVGAGIGLSSFFVQSFCGIGVVPIEPTYSGELGRGIFGLDIQSAFFEDLPPGIMASLGRQPCLLHLNSVIEHLYNPVETVRSLMARIDVEVIAAIVPDGEPIDPAQPMAAMLATLAPGDHLHLPTGAGMTRLLARLGFGYRAVQQIAGLLLVIGARVPVVIPDAAAVRTGCDRLLRTLLAHPDRRVAGGAASRLLSNAMAAGNITEMATLAPQVSEEIDGATILQRLRDGPAWEEVPFHLAPSSYALAQMAAANSDLPTALHWLDVVEAAAERLTSDHPTRGAQSVAYRWEARLFRAHLLKRAGRAEAAQACLESVVASAMDRNYGAAPQQVDRARVDIAALLPPSGLPLVH